MQAIHTKFAGPTNIRGSRVIATADAGRVILGWDYSKNSEENHVAAADALVKKLGWKSRIIGSGSMKNNGYCHVLGAAK